MYFLIDHLNVLNLSHLHFSFQYTYITCIILPVDHLNYLNPVSKCLRHCFIIYLFYYQSLIFKHRVQKCLAKLGKSPGSGFLLFTFLPYIKQKHVLIYPRIHIIVDVFHICHSTSWSLQGS